ncbi:uncharacterized protein [Prorops nasuta]|uniref:uncharacterized protein isoform X1 n=1 Tax=Prorops nasuta TaxID=863751 RepID=UPI0034CEA8CD
MNNNKENIKTLIMLYEQHPCLYVIKSKDYHNRVLRDKALQIISKSYEQITNEKITVDIIKKKLNGLRTQFLEQINKVKQSKCSGASSDEIYKPTWWLYDSMSFLEKHVAARKGNSSLKENVEPKYIKGNTSLTDLINSSSTEDLELADITLQIDDDNDLSNEKAEFRNCLTPPSSASTTITDEMNVKKKKRKTEDISEILQQRQPFWDNALDGIKKLCSNEDKNEDGLHYWIKFLEAELRKKNKKKLRRLQRGIMALVDDDDSDE